MKRVNWKLLRQRIPARIQIAKRTYEIVWVDGFKDPSVLGETRFEPYQIALKTNENDKETVKTYLHEVAHAVSEEEQIGLTESQVQKLEKSLTYLLKPNNTFLEK